MNILPCLGFEVGAMIAPYAIEVTHAEALFFEALFSLFDAMSYNSCFVRNEAHAPAR